MEIFFRRFRGGNLHAIEPRQHRRNFDALEKLHKEHLYFKKTINPCHILKKTFSAEKKTIVEIWKGALTIAKEKCFLVFEKKKAATLGTI